MLQAIVCCRYDRRLSNAVCVIRGRLTASDAFVHDAGTVQARNVSHPGDGSTVDTERCIGRQRENAATTWATSLVCTHLQGSIFTHSSRGHLRCQRIPRHEMHLRTHRRPYALRQEHCSRLSQSSVSRAYTAFQMDRRCLLRISHYSHCTGLGKHIAWVYWKDKARNRRRS